MTVMTDPADTKTDGALAAINVSDPGLYEHDVWQADFARLRREAPLHFTADSANGAFWSVTSHELIMAVDTNHKDFSSEVGGITIVDRPKDKITGANRFKSFIDMDEPDHSKLRKTVSPSVEPANLMNLEPLIRERAADILDNLPIGETFNWVQHVSVELTARMLATLFDFPYEERHKLIHWSDITTNVPQITGLEVDMHKRREELEQCLNAFNELWKDRSQAEPKFDLISMLVHGKNTNRMVEDPALYLGNLLLLIVGGNDTTRNSISGGVLALNQFPDQYQKLRRDPSVIPNMVAEIIRWQTPLIHMRRTALRDVELAGQTIRKGEKVVMWYLSGNRDETIFSDADKLIVDRPNARRHLSFGFGIHRCMGNRLAEMQLRVLWEEVMKRFHNIEIVGEVGRLRSNFVRGLVDLPVRIHPI